VANISALVYAIIGIILVIGAWTWLLILIKRGPWPLLGYEQVVVHKFETVVVYRNGSFSRTLSPGNHWLRLRAPQLVRVDVRPEVCQIQQGAMTSDRVPVILRCVARFQIYDARAAVENTQNYRNEVYARLQSVTKKLGEQRTLQELHLNHEEFNAVAQKLATDAIQDVGCTCIAFELLQAESAGALPDLEGKSVGFGPH
jgi:regulator of protease activity HflC (stomatin/prohibitin superfamily)